MRSFCCVKCILAAITGAALAVTRVAASADPGTKLWEFVTTDPILASPALAADGTIYVGSYDRKLHAVTPAGSNKWEFTLPTGGFTGIFSSPAIGPDGTVYFGAEDGNLYALNPTNGNSKWTFAAGDAVYSDPAIGSDGAIYIGSYSTPHSYLYAINTNGTQRWRYEPASGIYSDPVIALDGTIYFGCDDGKLYALNTNGTLRWTFNTGNFAITASPAIGANGKIYVGVGSTSNPRFYSVNTNGTTNWIFTATNRISSSAALGDDGTIYFGSDDGHLYALNPNGTLKWSAATGAAVGSSPALAADGTIYVGCDNGKLFAFGPTGSNLWSFASGNSVYSSPAIGTNGTVYVGSADGKLYALSGGNALARTAWPMFRRDVRHTARILAVTNTAPVISSITNQMALANTAVGPLPFTVSDAETPAGNLIVNAGSSNTVLVPNAQIQFSGTGSNRFVTITPASNQVGSAAITLTVIDAAGSSNSTSFLLTVEPSNHAPTFTLIADQMIAEESTLTITNIASDVDQPPQNLAFFLVSAPTNASINPVTGVFTWTPNEAQGPGSTPIVVGVSDNGVPSLSATQSFMVVVSEVNRAPLLAPIASRTVHQGMTVTVTLSATDPDGPANVLTYGVSSMPAGASFDPATGVFAWTPAEEQVNTTNRIIARVTDDGSPSLTDSNVFTIVVVSRPIIRSLVLGSNALDVTCTSIPGNRYRLLYKSELDNTGWSAVPGDVQATGNTVKITDSSLDADRRFYRVLVLPSE